MHRNAKMATCCYCGTRAALVLDAGRHELVCANCGAPLHDLKSLPIGAANTRAAVASAPPGQSAAAAAFSAGPNAKHAALSKTKKKKKAGKRRKTKFRNFFEEIADEIGDIFD